MSFYFLFGTTYVKPIKNLENKKQWSTQSRLHIDPQQWSDKYDSNLAC